MISTSVPARVAGMRRLYRRVHRLQVRLRGNRSDDVVLSL